MSYSFISDSKVFGMNVLHFDQIYVFIATIRRRFKQYMLARIIILNMS